MGAEPVALSHLALTRRALLEDLGTILRAAGDPLLGRLGGWQNHAESLPSGLSHYRSAMEPFAAILGEMSSSPLRCLGYRGDTGHELLASIAEGVVQSLAVLLTDSPCENVADVSYKIENKSSLLLEPLSVIYRNLPWNEWETLEDRLAWESRKLEASLMARSLDSESVNATLDSDGECGQTLPKMPSPNAARPRWDCLEGKLYWEGAVVREVVARAKNMRAVLDAFQEEGWPSRIDDPMPGGADSQRLRNTVRDLNLGLEKLHFCADGTGEGIIWEQGDGQGSP